MRGSLKQCLKDEWLLIFQLHQLTSTRDTADLVVVRHDLDIVLCQCTHT
jgi:hypothetical protein